MVTVCFNVGMEEQHSGNLPTHCPVCGGDLLVTRLECASCGTEVNGTFALGQLARLQEPHASLIDMFLRVRGNVKEMERELGLSYPTVRARLDEALEAAGYPRSADGGRTEEDRTPSPWDPQFGEDLAERIQRAVEANLAGWGRPSRRAERESDIAARRAEILDRLERGEIAADEAANMLRALKRRR